MDRDNYNLIERGCVCSTHVCVCLSRFNCLLHRTRTCLSLLSCGAYYRHEKGDEILIIVTIFLHCEVFVRCMCDGVLLFVHEGEREIEK